MCLVLPFCVVLAILKNKKVWLLFNFKSSIVVLSIYIRTLFYFKTSEVRKIKKERQGNKKNILNLRKMFIARFDLTIPEFRGQCANHCAKKDLELERVFVLFIDNLYL